MPLVASAVAAVAGLLLAATPAPPQVVLTLQDPTLLESSGLAVSATHPGVLWTHNDGGSVAQVLAVDPSGSTVATVTLAGIDPYDPEALAPGTDDRGRAALYLGDIGDNLRERLGDVLTDAVRAALLRRVGYRVEVVQFVSAEYTPRNTMIRAVRTGAAQPDSQADAEYEALVADWGVTPHLQTLLADDLAARR